MVSYESTLKILLLGDPEVDKSAIIRMYGYQSRTPNERLTIGVDFFVKTLVIDDKRYKLQLWDIGGEENFRFLLPTYCFGANAALLLYDITKPQTLSNIGEWVNNVRQKSGEIPIILIGIIPNENSKRQISAEEGKKIAKSKNLNVFMECNIKTGENIEKALEALTRLMLTGEENFFLEKEKKMEKKTREDNYSKSYFKLKYNRSKVRSKFIGVKRNSPKTPFMPPLHTPPPPKQLGGPVIAPQGQKSYRDQIINLLSKIERFWPLKNSRIIAVALIQGKDAILYSTDNWDISADVGRVISSWSSMNAQFIMLSGVKYSVLQCTSERLVATSIRGEGHILGTKDEDYTLILHVEPDFGSDDNDDRFPYPYIFKPPSPPDDLALTPRVQLHSSPKKKDPEEKISCQYCGMKLTKEEQFTHSCKKKP